MNFLNKQFTCSSVVLFFLMFFLYKTTHAQQFIIDTVLTTGQKSVDTIPEITVYGKRLKPDEKVITYSTFRRNFLFNNRGVGMNSTYFELDSIYIFPLCIPINNQKGFAVQIDSIYLKGSNLPSDKIQLYFNLYKDNKRLQIQTATKSYRRKKINVFVFGQGIRLPKGESYLSFNYKLIDTPIDFTVKTNPRITGALYSYNKGRDEFQLIDSVMITYDDKSKNHIESTENNPHASAPQVKIFCSFIK